MVMIEPILPNQESLSRSAACLSLIGDNVSDELCTACHVSATDGNGCLAGPGCPDAAS
jgi:hypothetical protein